MPRKKADTQGVEERAKAPRKPRKTQEEKLQEKMDADLKQMLEKHKREIAEAAKAMDAKQPPKEPDEAEETEEAEQSEPDPEALEEVEKPKDPGDAMEPLTDPTIGQDLTHNMELTMDQFFQKTLSLLHAATNAVRSAQYRYDVTARKLETVTRQLKHHNELLRALGFKYAKEGSWVTPRLRKCWTCDSVPSLQKAKTENEWLVICDQCWTRTESAEGPMQAIKNWNDQKETEVSLMLNRPMNQNG